ncbi:Dermatopontin 22 kDa extracellular matrix protein [Collichthys lucidus]|uniref:Dermatopontin 22 kDa extracellular matrix protein n=1 Tax=Collichthys lucidus TaxID=240159 RepID=A0A4U5UKM5_COLLU|nr:Dermatopontin 22 kDa extracellular matrix protein [Collichthys lucidus]
MNPAPVLVALSLLAMVAAQSQDHYDMDWVNAYRQGFNFQCPHGEALVAIRSYYNEQEGSDRLWSFECQATPEGLGEPTDCWWDDISRAGMEWTSTCTRNGVVAGVQSKYFESVLDREWQFYCCYYKRRCPYSCMKTSDIPEHHREEAEMVIPSYGYFIRGAQTTFSGVLRARHGSATQLSPEPVDGGEPHDYSGLLPSETRCRCGGSRLPELEKTGGSLS